MPNWVRNIVRIEGPAEDIAKVIELMRDKEPGRENEIDFSNILPMPERLNIVSGGYDKYYVAAYLNTLTQAEQWYLRLRLSSYPVGYYGDYAKKYAESFMMLIPDEYLKRMRRTFSDEYKNISPASIEDVGKTYIDNILEYGADTWYEWNVVQWGTKWNACDGTILENGFDFDTAWSAPFPIINELSRRFPELSFSHTWADENIDRNCGKHEIKNGAVMSQYYPEGDEAYEFACKIHGYDPEEEEE